MFKSCNFQEMGNSAHQSKKSDKFNKETTFLDLRPESISKFLARLTTVTLEGKRFIEIVSDER